MKGDNYIRFVNNSQEEKMKEINNLMFVFPLKLFELVLLLACLALHTYGSSCTTDGVWSILFSGTFLGFIIIHLGSLYGDAKKTPMSPNVHIFFTIVGSFLYVACGGIIIYTYMNYESGNFRLLQLIKGTISIVTGITFITDGIMNYIGSERPGNSPTN